MSKGSGMGAGWMAQIQQLQQQLEKAKEELAHETVEAGAGGGAIKVVMSGTQECQSVEIAPRLLEEGDIEMLQDLIMLAVNQAIHDSQVLAARRLGPLAGGIPGMGGMD